MLAEKKNNWYVELLDKIDQNDILPGVKEFIKMLKEFKIKIALGSASKNAMLILDKLQLSDDFDVIIDGSKVSKAKPDPEVFLLAASELSIQPKYCAVFEDAPAGVEAAMQANMFCVGVGSKQVLSKANLVISGFEDPALNVITNYFIDQFAEIK
jgi:beta-phosphoglucomutase